MHNQVYKKRAMVTSVFLFFLIMISFIALRDIRANQISQTIVNLSTLRDATHSNIKNIWVKGRIANVSIWAKDEGVVKKTENILKLRQTRSYLLKSAALIQLRKYFRGLLKQDEVRGVFIISPDYINVASMRASDIGRTNFIVRRFKHRLDRALLGHALIIPPTPPIRSDEPRFNQPGRRQDGSPTMFVVAPIKNKSGKVIALLTVRLDPFRNFSKLAQSMSTGETGEVYAFNKHGDIISETRFHGKDAKIGFMKEVEYYTSNFYLRDLEHSFIKGESNHVPFDRMAFSKVIHQFFKTKKGTMPGAYRDYRGVLVFGAWAWDKDLEMGFVAEIDQREALQSYFVTRIIAIVMLIITLLVALFFVYFMRRIMVQNNKEIEASAKYLQAILDNTLDGIITANRYGHIQSFNVAAEHLLGYKSSEVMGQRISMLAPAFLKNRTNRLMRNLLSIKKKRAGGLQLEGLLKHKTGEIIPIRFAINVMNLKGQDYFVGIVQDLSNKKESERALQESEAQFRETFSNAPIGIASLSLDGYFIKVNFHFCSLFGYSEAELLSLSLKDVHQGDPWLVGAIIERIKQQKGKSLSLENEYVTKSGKQFWGLVTLTIAKKNGKSDHLIAVLEDITVSKQANNELKIRTAELENSNRDLQQSRLAALSVMQDANLQQERAEQALSELEQRTLELQKLSRAIEHSSSVVVITDKEGLIEYVNPSFAKMTGYSVEEVIGQNPNLLNTGYHSRDFFKNMWDFILGGNVWQGEIMNKKKKGDLFWQSVSIAPIFNEEGDITHFVAVMDDITQQKIIDKELRKAKETAELATKTKSEFLASMSHEIRTPMNGIIGMIYLLSETSLTDKQKNYMMKIDYSAKNLLAIINDILDFSKIEAGKLDININSFNIYETVESIIAVNSIKAQEKGLNLILDIQEDIPSLLLGDSLRIGQIIINLVGNAIKFTHEGKIVVVLKKEREDGDSATIKFSVKDSGIGITESQRQDLFQPFTQADSSTTRKYGGTGLGLTICRNLIDLMGGDIWLESKAGEGSVFSFRLKLLKTSLISDDTAGISPNANSKNDFSAIAGATVLLAEDNLINQEVAQALLERYSLNFTTVNNGQEAIDLLFEGEVKFDLVLMDLRMPIMDGITATSLIRKNESFKDLKIIAMTADAMEGVRQMTLDIGMDDYISKPIDPLALEALLLKWISPKSRKAIKREVIYSASAKNKLPENYFPDFPGILLEAGLKSVEGNKELYKKILTHFYEEYQDIYQRVKEALEQGDEELGLSLVHTLKGVAGTIGAKDLMTVSSKFQTALMDKKEEDIPQLLEQLSFESQIVIAGLRLFAEEGLAKTNESTKWDSNFIIVTLKELQIYLSKNKPRQSKLLIADLNKYDWPKQYASYFHDMSDFVDVYQFKQAEDVLKILLEKINS